MLRRFHDPAETVGHRLLVIAGRGLLIVVASLVIVYIGDDLAVRYRMAHRTARDPLEEVTVYYATPLKNGKLQIFYDSPQSEVCVRSIFPHLGRSPCWRIRRNNVKVISGRLDPAVIAAIDADALAGDVTRFR